MKIFPAGKSQGNILIVSVFTTAAVGLVLLSYLQLGNSHETFTARSQSWNMALPVAEAGLEEALTHINYNQGKKLTSNGWAKVSGDYVKTTTLSTDSYYAVTIKDGKTMEITSTGYVRTPRSTNFISRTIAADAKKTNMIFVKAMIARKHIRTGKGTLIDSFDSTDNKYSTGGKYDLTKHKDTASIASTSNKKNAIKVDKTKVYGDAAVQPKGNVEFKGTGVLGDQAWVDAKNLGAQTGKIDTTFTYDFPVVQEPWEAGTGSAPPSGKYGKVDAQYILGDGDYELGATTLSKPLVVKTNATATLYVTGDFKASDDIIISKGATLKFYMGGKKFEVKDKDVTINDSDASQFQYYGMPKNKDVRFAKKGDVALYGIIYAPQAKIKIEGGNDLMGSVVGKCIHLKHDGSFHYDEGINKKSSDYDMYFVSSWLEK